MTIRVVQTIRNAQLDLVADAVDAGPGHGTVKVYTGAQPATADTAVTGTLLATFTCEDPAFGSAGAGSVAMDTSPILSTTAVATGVPGYARVADSTGAAVFDGSVGTSAADFIISASPINSGQTVTIDTGVLNNPA